MALTLEVKNAEGKKVGSVDLPADIFDAQTNIPLIHQVVTAQLAAARQGTQKAKNRGETSGSGKKPFKQKGPGRVFRGKKMMGRMGVDTVTTQNLLVHSVDAEKSLLLIKGAIPGPTGSIVFLRSAAKMATSETVGA